MKEVAEHIKIFGRGGGFIFSSIHNIQALVPVKNLLALYDTLCHSGRYPL